MKVEEHVISEIGKSTDNLYFQLDSLISINKVLEEDLIKKPIDLIIVDGHPGVIEKKSRYPAIPILSEYMNDG